MLNMMVIIKFNIISCFLCFLIVPCLFVDTQESNDDTIRLVPAYFSRCTAYVPTDCLSLSLSSDLSVVHELPEKCLYFHKRGCDLGKLNSFCSTGIERALNTVNKTKASCNFNIPDDVDLAASGCCTICNEGIQQVQSGEKCETGPNFIPERMKHFCCDSINKSSPINFSSNALFSATSLEPSNSTPPSSTRSPGSEESFNHSATLPNCIPGFELDSNKTQCVYSDHCKKDPCFQSDENEHYCINYFIGRKCIYKVPADYVWEEKYNLLKLKDTSKISSDPILLDLAQTEITLTKDDYKDFPFVHLKLPKSFKCSWEKKLDQTWPLIPGQGLKEDQLKVSDETNYEYKISLNGAVQPQAAAISIDCKTSGQIHYRHTVYFTFNPHPNKTI